MPPMHFVMFPMFTPMSPLCPHVSLASPPMSPSPLLCPLLMGHGRNRVYGDIGRDIAGDMGTQEGTWEGHGDKAGHMDIAGI